MATSFPSSIDSFTNPSASDALDSVSVPHADQHANINDAMVAVQTKLGVGSGTIGTYTTYTPILTNLTLGNGYGSLAYTQINKLVHVVGGFTFGSTSTFGGAQFTFSLPVTAANANGGGTAYLGDTGSFNYLGVVFQNGVNTFSIMHAGGGYFGLVNSANPFTWSGSNNDSIRINLIYEAA